jgi:hypothetical protein
VVSSRSSTGAAGSDISTRSPKHDRSPDLGEEIAQREVRIPVTLDLVSADEAVGVEADPR